MNQLSLAGQIQERLQERILKLQLEANPTCNGCQHLLGAVTERVFTNGQLVICNDCNREYMFCNIGLLPHDSPAHWLAHGAPSWLSHPFLVSCPQCAINDGILLSYICKDDKEYKAFNRNMFDLLCVRCGYNQPKFEYEMGELKHFLWLFTTHAAWSFVQTLTPYTAEPLKMKGYKRPNPGRRRESSWRCEHCNYGFPTKEEAEEHEATHDLG